MKRTITWIFWTVLIYLCLAAGFWLAGGDTRSSRFYLIAALPVFLFSALFYALINRMRRDMYEDKS